MKHFKIYGFIFVLIFTSAISSFNPSLASTNMQTNPKCSPVEDQPEIQECSENKATIVVHDGNLGVEMPEVSYTSSATAHFSNGTWTEHEPKHRSMRD